jgi:hypothetical protein
VIIKIHVVRLGLSLNLQREGHFSLSPRAGKSSIAGLSARLMED